MRDLMQWTDMVKEMNLEVLEVALEDATKRAKDGMEIKNIPYAEKQIRICEIIRDEILTRKIQS